MQLFGVGAIVVIWALQVAWIARTARDRGRSILVWATVGAAAGLAGLFAAKELIASSLEWAGGDAKLMATMVAPLVFVVVPMAGIAVALTRAPAYAAHRETWRVHSPRRGTGKLSIRRDGLSIEWPDGTEDVPFASLRRAEPDGECLRLSWSESDHTLMPMEKPDTRPGRQAQARALAAQIATARKR
jgi:hypothetical protein